MPHPNALSLYGSSSRELRSLLPSCIPSSHTPESLNEMNGEGCCAALAGLGPDAQERICSLDYSHSQPCAHANFSVLPQQIQSPPHGPSSQQGSSLWSNAKQLISGNYCCKAGLRAGLCADRSPKQCCSAGRSALTYDPWAILCGGQSPSDTAQQILIGSTVQHALYAHADAVLIVSQEQGKCALRMLTPAVTSGTALLCRGRQSSSGACFPPSCCRVWHRSTPCAFGLTAAGDAGRKAPFELLKQAEALAQSPKSIS